MAVLTSTDFNLRGPEQDGGLTITLTRYTLTEEPEADTSGESLSLLFIHGVSYHKETWLPTIENLFEMQAAVKSNKFRIVEAWAMDSPNHGQAAIVNESRLQAHPNGITAHELARAVQVFLKSGLYKGQSLIGIAHSASVAVITLSTLGYPTSRLPYSSLILVESPIMTREVFAKVTKHGKPWEILVEMAKKRKDIWASREQAREWMSTRMPWNTWAPRCIDLFVQYALRELPTAKYPDRKGVTLCCTREQEVAGYVYHRDGFDAIDRLSDVCSSIPVHCIFGEREDVVPAFVKAGFMDSSQGRRMASVVTVANVGHLIVEEDPKGLALAIWGAISQSAGRPKMLAHL